MSREINNDFKKLQIFINNYSLAKQSKRQEFYQRIKPMHKKLFALLTFIVEYEYQHKRNNISSDNSINYFKECASDMGQAFFCWIHGAYKPANLILRSSIETFVRAAAGKEKPEIFLERNVYNVFQIAKETDFFKSELCLKFFQKLHFGYKELCKIVHSDSSEGMEQISALNIFPLFSPDKANMFSLKFLNLSTIIITLIYINFYSFLHTMHHKNQINFFCAVPKSIKKEINAIMG